MMQRNLSNTHATVTACETHIVSDRAGFFALLEQAIGVARDGSAPVLIVIDLPGLRDTGDAVAQLTDLAAQRLAQVLGGHGFLGLQPGGRFAVLIASDGAVSALAMAQGLLASLAAPIRVDGITVSARAMLGMAHWDDDGLTAEELFVAADRAIYQASAATARGGAGYPFAGIRFLESPLRKRA